MILTLIAEVVGTLLVSMSISYALLKLVDLISYLYLLVERNLS